MHEERKDYFNLTSGGRQPSASIPEMEKTPLIPKSEAASVLHKERTAHLGSGKGGSWLAFSLS